MPIAIAATSDTGRTLFASLTQLSDAGTPGLVWNVTGGVWATAPAVADRKITLAEGSSPDVGRYTGGVLIALGTYTGRVLVQIHDDVDNDVVIGTEEQAMNTGTAINIGATAYLSNYYAQLGYVQAQTAATQSTAANGKLPADTTAKLAFLDIAVTTRLATSGYTAPDNTGIGNALTQATNAANSAAAANAKLPADTTAKLAYLDASVNSRLATSGYTAPANSTIVTAAADALAAKNSALVTEGRLTAVRAGYLDNLSAGAVATHTVANAAKTAAESVDGKLTTTRAGYLDNLAAGAVATAASVASIQNTTRTKFFGPAEQQIPATSSVVCRYNLMLFDSLGNMEAPDSLPTVTAANQAGTDRSGNLGAVTNVSTGHYYVDYTVSNAHAEEQVILTAVITEGGVALKDISTTKVVALSTGSGFTTADRTKLESVFNKLPSRAYLVGTAAADGDLNLDNCDGDKTAFMADVSSLPTILTQASNAATQATAANTKLPADTTAKLANLDIAVTTRLATSGYTAPDNTTIATAATQAGIAATQASTAASAATTASNNSATLIDRLTAGRATNLDNLDALVSTRSDFNHATDGVILTAGHGLALAADQTAIKAKTDLLPTTPAAQSDIPTAGAIATQVDVTLTASHGSGSWHEHSDATLAKQNAILAAIAGVVPGTPASAVNVSPLRTWVVSRDAEEAFASNIIVVSADSIVVLAMDFSQLLNEGTSITAVSTVEDISGNGLVASELAPSQDKMKAHFKVSPTLEGVRHELKVTISTTDEQTITATGVLRVD